MTPQDSFGEPPQATGGAPAVVGLLLTAALLIGGLLFAAYKLEEYDARVTKLGAQVERLQYDAKTSNKQIADLYDRLERLRNK